MNFWSLRTLFLSLHTVCKEFCGMTNLNNTRGFSSLCLNWVAPRKLVHLLQTLQQSKLSSRWIPPSAMIVKEDSQAKVARFPLASIVCKNDRKVTYIRGEAQSLGQACNGLQTVISRYTHYCTSYAILITSQCSNVLSSSLTAKTSSSLYK